MKFPFAVKVVLSATLVTSLQVPVTVRPSIVTVAKGVCTPPVYVSSVNAPTVAPVISFFAIVNVNVTSSVLPSFQA